MPIASNGSCFVHKLLAGGVCKEPRDLIHAHLTAPRLVEACQPLPEFLVRSRGVHMQESRLLRDVISKRRLEGCIQSQHCLISNLLLSFVKQVLAGVR